MLKNIHKSKLVLIMLVVLLIIGTIVIITTQKPQTTEIVTEPVTTENFTNDLPPPPGFMPQNLTESTTSTTTIDEATATEAETKPPEFDPQELKRQEEIDNFLKRRDARNRSSAGGFVVKYKEQDQVNYAIENIDQYRNMDKDFSAQKTPTTITSRPVDLSRTLPMTEIIPVILIDEIKSELAGEVVRASIPQDVYAYHGRKILIPAGSTAIGRYKPLQKIGDTRLAISFYRIVTPEGINIKLSGFAADIEGSEGLSGEIDNKTKEKFGGAGIAALLQAMAQLSINVESEQQKAVAGAVTQPLNEVMTQVISQSINIAPTLRIPKGATFNIKFASDIWFPDPVASIIETVAL